MVKCKNCGHDNDPSASYCENCGKKITGISNKNFNIQGNETGFSNLTKVLILVCILLVIGVGITAGYLIKNNQQAPVVAINGSNNNTGSNNNQNANSVSKNDGFPLSEAPDLAYQIMKNNGTIASVTYNGVKLDKNQCIYILMKAVIMLNSGQTGYIPINSYGSAANPAGTVTSATITKSDYVNMASRTVSWMDQYKNTPNFVGITNPGQPDLSPDTALNMFAKILSDYKATGQLPQSVSIP